MPVLSRGPFGEDRGPGVVKRDLAGRVDGLETGAGIGFARRVRAGIFASCSNPGCRSGWLHVLRSRSAPVFEGGWTCSAECTRARIQAALGRELDGGGSVVAGYRHRTPLGLLMMEQGWITRQELRQSLEAQREAGGGRLGEYLMSRHGISEQLVTRALSLQWSCPVLPLAFHDPQGMASLLPRLFVDAFGALPLRVAAGRLCYLGFEERLDPVLALALERMSGLRVESGLVAGSEFRPAHERMLKAAFPRVELLEAISEPVLVGALCRSVERARPFEARLVRVHECLWLRMWMEPLSGAIPGPDSVADVIASVGA